MRVVETLGFQFFINIEKVTGFPSVIFDRVILADRETIKVCITPTSLHVAILSSLYRAGNFNPEDSTLAIDKPIYNTVS